MTRHQHVDDPTTVREDGQASRRAHRASHLLLAAQLVQHHLHRQRGDAHAQQRIAAARPERRRRHALWADYLRTPAGEAFTAWRAEALMAQQVRDVYTELWNGAWLDELASDVPPRFDPRDSRHAWARGAWWVVAAALLAACVADAVLLDRLGDPLLQLAVNAAAATAVLWPASRLLRRLRSAGRRRAAAAHQAVLDARAQQRAARFGIPVIEERLEDDGRITATVVDSWHGGDAPVEWRYVQHFIEQARDELPEPHQLPMTWATVEAPRAPDGRYPAAVALLLDHFASGRIAEVGPTMQQLLVTVGSPDRLGEPAGRTT